MHILNLVTEYSCADKLNAGFAACHYDAVALTKPASDHG
jgi:hypothetical protein